MPTLGISAGLAMEDAAVLGECIREAEDGLAGVRQYEAQRRRTSEPRRAANDDVKSAR